MNFKRVVSFRPKGGAAERVRDWTAPLKEKGIELVELPLLEVVSALRGSDPLAGVEKGSWLLFTSANAVWFTLPFLDNRDFPLACIGEQTAALLREQGRSAQFVPGRADGKSFAAELVPILREITPVPACVFLRGRVVSPHLAAGLKEAGIHVEEIIVYESRPITPPPVGLGILREHAGASDTALIFTSSESLRELLESAEVWELDLEKLRANPCFAIGPETERSLRDAAFSVVQVAEHASLEALVDKILGK